MRGHIRKRSPGSWELLFDTYVLDAAGKRKRKVKSVTVRGTKREAEQKLHEVLHKAASGDFVEPSRLTFGAWLDSYLRTLEPLAWAERTWVQYRSCVRKHILPGLGLIRLQELQVTHLEAYYRAKAKTLSPATLAQHHGVISGALRSALKKQYVSRNVAQLVDTLPKIEATNRAAMDNCWNETEALRFLQAAVEHSAQVGAFFALELDSGMRVSEICGLPWFYVDLDASQITVAQQLRKPGPPPQFGRLKQGKARTIDISPQTVQLLKKHRQSQSEERLKNGKHWTDNGLVFARGWNETPRSQYLGSPIRRHKVNSEWVRPLCELSGVKEIRFHGLRHTAATLLLKVGVASHVVAQRIGHSNVKTTLEVYSHALPSQQKDAASKLAAIMQL